jgi:hypothetical protein
MAGDFWIFATKKCFKVAALFRRIDMIADIVTFIDENKPNTAEIINE